MAGDNLNVWYDPEGDHLEIVFDQKAGYFEDTSLENVMRKRDTEGTLLAISIFNLSSFAKTRPQPESTSGYGLARNPRAFHVDRNLYRCIRWDPLLGPDWLAFMTPDDPAGAKFFKRVARLMIATDLFEQANEGHALSGEMRLMWLVMAAEALFTDDDKSELGYRLATRMAFLNASSRSIIWSGRRSCTSSRSKTLSDERY